MLFLLAFLFVPSSVALAQQASSESEHAQLEARFAAMLSGAQLVGWSTADDRPADAAPQPDSYQLGEVRKLENGKWRIEWKRGALTLPVVVPVEWAGDTPIIAVRELTIPLMGTFDARVMFHDDQYVGIWSGAGHGGQMGGRVVHAGEDAPQASEPETGAAWPQFRGPDARGLGAGEALATWNVPSGEGVLWTSDVPGLSHSSPVIGGGRIFLTTSVGEKEAESKLGLYGGIAPVEDEGEQSFEVHCFDQRTGEALWKQVAFQGVPAVKRHPKGSHAASTPATDGEHVVAFFGSEGLFCYTADGEKKWERDFGTLESAFFMVPSAQWGFASSPVIHGERVLVQCDVLGDSFLAALSLADGSTIWRTEREEVPTWSTPTVDVRDGRSQVIVNGFKHIGAYDLETGEELWRLKGGGDIPVPTPVVADELVYITNAHGSMAPILAIEASASGTLELEGEGADDVAWGHRRGGNYMQTPLALDGLLYLCSDGGIIACYDAKSGEQLYRERLGDGTTGFTSSPVAADGKLYYASEAGEVHVVRAGREFEVLAVNDLGQPCMATPALVDGVLYYRTRSRLVALGG